MCLSSFLLSSSLTPKASLPHITISMLVLHRPMVQHYLLLAAGVSSLKAGSGFQSVPSHLAGLIQPIHMFALPKGETQPTGTFHACDLHHQCYCVCSDSLRKHSPGQAAPSRTAGLPGSTSLGVPIGKQHCCALKDQKTTRVPTKSIPIPVFTRP